MAEPADFQEVLNLWPDHAPAAWQDVQKQLTAEYATLEETNVAKLSFSAELKGLAQQFGTTIEQAAPAAALHTISKVTRAGCIEAVTGLVNTIQQGVHSPEDDAKLATQCIGVLVSVGVAAGIATAGVGSAIIGVVSTIVAVLAQAGMFGKPAPGSPIPGSPGFTANPPASQVIGAGVPRWGLPIAGPMIPSIEGPKVNPDWYKFPELTPAMGDPNGALPQGASWAVRIIRAWYSNIGSPGQHTNSWEGFSLISQSGHLASIRGVSYWQPDGPTGSWYGDFSGQRPIDIAFPAYQRLKDEMDSLSPGGRRFVAFVMAMSGDAVLMRFHQAYFAAYKKNCERSINGQNMSTDAEVLAYVLKIWNRAHDPAPQGKSDIILRGDGSGPGLYIQTLLGELRAKGLTDDFGADLQSIVIHAGGQHIAKPPSLTAGLLKAGVLLKQPAHGPPPVKPVAIKLVPGSPLRALTVTPANVPLWKRALPYVPAAAGAAAFPVVGPLALVVGGAATGVWVLRKKGVM